MSVIVLFINKTMEWFKFYGQEFLTDPKMLSLTAIERSLWITVLCLANNTEDGVIRYVDEYKIMMMTNISQIDDEWQENEGFLKHFENLGMVKRDDNGISVINFVTKQNKSLSSYERVKRYRERQKAKETNDNVTRNVSDNAREDKRRIDKKRIDLEKEIVKKKNHTLLEEVLDVDVDEIARKYTVPSHFVWSKLDDLKNWHEKNPAKNKYVNYKAALTDWVKRDAMNIQKEAHGQSKIAYINTDSGGADNSLPDQTNQRIGLSDPETHKGQHFEGIGGGG